jgi:hypothetical protein
VQPIGEWAEEYQRRKALEAAEREQKIEPPEAIARAPDVSRKRTSADLGTHLGQYRSFGWYSDCNDEMPGLDAYAQLTKDKRSQVLASFIHWGDVAEGDRPLRSRVNVENGRPLILAVKAGQHRFLAFPSGRADEIEQLHFGVERH